MPFHAGESLGEAVHRFDVLRAVNQILCCGDEAVGASVGDFLQRGGFHLFQRVAQLFLSQRRQVKRGGQVVVVVRVVKVSL